MGVKIWQNFYPSQIASIRFQTPSITHCHKGCQQWTRTYTYSIDCAQIYPLHLEALTWFLAKKVCMLMWDPELCCNTKTRCLPLFLCPHASFSPWHLSQAFYPHTSLYLLHHLSTFDTWYPWLLIWSYTCILIKLGISNGRPIHIILSKRYDHNPVDR